MGTTLEELVRAKVAVESQIRAERVKRIRRVRAKGSTSRATESSVENLVRVMESHLHAVHYCHQTFDDLLVQIETKLGIEE